MNYESTLIRQIDRESAADEDRAELLQARLIPTARNRGVSWEQACAARREVVALVKELQEIN